MDWLAAARGLRFFGSGPLPHPAYLIFFVTSKCVGKCRHCFYWESINQPESPLTLEETDKVAASMGKIWQVTFTGGEPFLRDDIVDLVETFYRRNQVYHLGIATSGWFPERTAAAAERILKNCGRANLTIGLPIEGPPDLNDDIRGVPGFYRRTTETLAALRGLRSPRLTTLVDITASGFNRGRLMETYTHVRDELKPDAINVILTRGVPREPEAKTLDPAEVEALLGMMADDARAGKVRGYGFLSKLLHAKDLVLRRMALDIYRGGSCPYPCEAGRVAGVLMPEGDVYPCELWADKIGNVREADYNFPAVWNSPAAVKARSEIVSSRCSCYHQCFLSNTIFWNPRAWPGMAREWIKL